MGGLRGAIGGVLLGLQNLLRAQGRMRAGRMRRSSFFCILSSRLAERLAVRVAAWAWQGEAQYGMMRAEVVGGTT